MNAPPQGMVIITYHSLGEVKGGDDWQPAGRPLS